MCGDIHFAPSTINPHIKKSIKRKQLQKLLQNQNLTFLFDAI